MKRTNDLVPKPFSCAGRNPTHHAYNRRIMESSAQTRRTSPLIAAIAAAAFCALLWGLPHAADPAAQKAPARTRPPAPRSPLPQQSQETQFDASAATGANDALIDASHVQDGYVSASATSNARIKAQVISGQASSSFDMPQDGTPIACPLAFGDGPYTVRIMRNTSGNNYVELCSADIDVALNSKLVVPAPERLLQLHCFQQLRGQGPRAGRRLREPRGCPTRDLHLHRRQRGLRRRQGCEAQGFHRLHPRPGRDAAVGQRRLLRLRKLGAAMLRSQGIPGAKIVTGTVSPQGIYHAWIMVNIDGTWQSARFRRFPKHLVAHRPDLCGNGRRGERRGRRKLHRPLCVLAALRLTRSHTAETGTTGTAVEGAARSAPVPPGYA